MFQQTQPKDKMIHHDIPVRPWDITGKDMFTLNNKYYLCVVDYHSKFPIIKKAEDLSADSLILTCKIIFADYGIPKKNNVRHKWQFYFRLIQDLLQKPKHRMSLLVILPPSEQLVSRGMY